MIYEVSLSIGRGRSGELYLVSGLYRNPARREYHYSTSIHYLYGKYLYEHSLYPYECTRFARRVRTTLLLVLVLTATIYDRPHTIPPARDAEWQSSAQSKQCHRETRWCANWQTISGQTDPSVYFTEFLSHVVYLRQQHRYPDFCGAKRTQASVCRGRQRGMPPSHGAESANCTTACLPVSLGRIPPPPSPPSSAMLSGLKYQALHLCQVRMLPIQPARLPRHSLGAQQRPRYARPHLGQSYLPIWHVICTISLSVIRCELSAFIRRALRAAVYASAGGSWQQVDVEQGKMLLDRQGYKFLDLR